MSNFLCIVLVASFLQVRGLGQETLWFSNVNAYTRIGSETGPFAGPTILAQLLIGRTVDSLAPVGETATHRDGFVRGPVLTVPGISYYEIAQVQMVVWDGSLWGPSLAGVPADQFGKTDIVPVKLGNPLLGVPPYPEFKQAAVVPIPEPSTLALAVLGAAALALGHGRRKRSSVRRP